MSDYFLSALGHSVRCPDGTFLVFYYSINNDEWMIRANGRLYYAEQFRLFLGRENAILDALV